MKNVLPEEVIWARAIAQLIKFHTEITGVKLRHDTPILALLDEHARAVRQLKKENLAHERNIDRLISANARLMKKVAERRKRGGEDHGSHGC